MANLIQVVKYEVLELRQAATPSPLTSIIMVWGTGLLNLRPYSVIASESICNTGNLHHN